MQIGIVQLLSNSHEELILDSKLVVSGCVCHEFKNCILLDCNFITGLLKKMIIKYLLRKVILYQNHKMIVELFWVIEQTFHHHVCQF